MKHVIDGSLTDWTASELLSLPGTSASGYELYGTVETTGTGTSATSSYVFGLQASVPIGVGTNFWLNTDQNIATGKQIFGGTADTGAEYYVSVGRATASGPLQPLLYDAGGNYIEPISSYAFSADGKSLEFSLAGATINKPTGGNIDVKVNVNSSAAYLPSVYAGNTYTVTDPATVTAPASHTLKIGIVYSDTTAAHYFGTTDPTVGQTAYDQLFMASQNQATAAGVPFDVLTESDLKNIAKISQYSALVFPDFSNVKTADFQQIQSTLTQAVYQYHVGLITSGDFMTNDQNGAALPGDPYATMKALLDLQRDGGTTAVGGSQVQVTATGAGFIGYTAGEAVRTYPTMSTSWYSSADGTAPTVLANQLVAGDPTQHEGVVSTVTGGTNVHFANQSLLGDNNMLQHAIDLVVDPKNGPVVQLHMSRDAAIVASRTDMDQAKEPTDVSPGPGQQGIYDKLLPILAQWKAQYNFVGSYYIDIGDGTGGSQTNWAVSKPYYQQLLAMGNEIGSHSITHPEDTNKLTAAQIQTEFQGSKTIIQNQLGIPIDGAAVPGMPELVQTSKAIEQYYSYITGGATLVGAGYPGAIGHLTPDDAKVYIAPDTSFDFTLVDFQKLGAAGAEAAWAKEWTTDTAHSDLPVVVWPWHDYGPTSWSLDPGATSNYTTAMYTDFIARAAAAGSEFVTLDDLAQRVASFDASNLQYSFDSTAQVITATVGTADAGKFALDLSQLSAGSKIKSVAGYYAYDDKQVFIDKDGGTFQISLGAAADDVTHLAKVADRAELTSVTGDGTNLRFDVTGEGTYLVDLKNPNGGTVTVASAAGNDMASSISGNVLTVKLTGLGAHTVTVTETPINHPPVVAAPLTAGLTQGGTSTSYDLLAGASDPDASDAGKLSVGNLTYAVGSAAASSTLPAGVSYDAATHLLTVDPRNAAFTHLADKATQTITVAYDVLDPQKASAHQTETITITGINDAPTVAAALSASATVGGASQSLNLLSGASDPDDGDTAALTVTGLTYAVAGAAAVSALPAGLTFDGAHTLTIDPANAAFASLAAGASETLLVNYAVVDTHGASISQSETITVTGTAPINHPPVVAAPLTAGLTQGGTSTSYDLLAGASDPDASDAGKLSVGNLTYAVGSAAASSTLPAGVSYDAATHLLTVDPGNAAFTHLADKATQTITVAYDVLDPQKASAHQTETITITGINDAPTVAAALSASATVGGASQSLNLLSGASDPDDGDTAALTVTGLTYAVAGAAAVSALPAGLTFDGAHTLTIDPANAAFASLAAGASETLLVNYAVVDTHGASISQSETITVTGTAPINHPPVVAAPLTAGLTQGGTSTSYDLLAGASDPDASDAGKLSVGNLTYAVGSAAASSTLPAGVSYDAATHLLTVDPGNAAFTHLADKATQTITVAYDVLDPQKASAHQTETITITGINDAPTVAAALSASATVGGASQSLNLLSGASDPDDGDTAALTVTGLTYAVAGAAAVSALPAGLTFDGAHTLTIDPANAAFASLAAGASETLLVNYAVVDTHGASISQSETITVTGTAPINHPPWSRRRSRPVSPKAARARAMIFWPVQAIRMRVMPASSAWATSPMRSARRPPRPPSRPASATMPPPTC